MNTWYFPSWNGDIRVEADPEDDDKSTITIIKPTDQELKLLVELQAVFETRGYRKGELWDPKGAERQTFELKAPLLQVGQLLLPKLKPTKQTLTAVTVAGGDIQVFRGNNTRLGALEELLGNVSTDKESSVVSVVRPTPCCPSCIPGEDNPAEEVLFAFLDDDEKHRWTAERNVVAIGNRTGHRYLLNHRHSKLAQKIGWVCYDMDDRHHLHFYDWSVPPEEEVLASKLILEHAEEWLRNEATCFHSKLKFKNPFGNVMDGTFESGLLAGVGMAARVVG